MPPAVWVLIVALAACKDWEQLSSRTARCDAACAEAGGTCTGEDQCALPCRGGPCVCPDRHDCVISTEAGATPLAIDCTNAAACEVRCFAMDACDYAQITCGSGPCRVACTGEFSCGEFTVACGSGPCTVDCTQDGACGGANVACGPTERCELECTQQGCPSLRFDCGQAAECNGVCAMVGQVTCDGATLDCADSPSCSLECNGNEARCE